MISEKNKAMIAFMRHTKLNGLSATVGFACIDLPHAIRTIERQVCNVRSEYFNLPSGTRAKR